MNIRFKNALRYAVVAAMLTSAPTAHAQVPEHQPGSICATPTFWCWAQIWGPVGSLCYCGTAGGAVAGTYV